MSKAAPSKPAPAKKAAKKGKGASTKEGPGSQVQVPAVVDLVLSISKALVILVAILTAAVTLSSGADPLVAALRTGAAVLVVGLVMYAVSWLVAQGTISAAEAERKAKVEEMQQADKAATTLEFEA